LLFPYLTPIYVSCCAGCLDIADQNIPPPLYDENIMSKEKKSNKESKKKALMTPKEKKAAKKMKKATTGLFANDHSV
jgi:hypothetical protein